MNLFLFSFLACAPFDEGHFKALWEQIAPIEKKEIHTLIKEREEEIGNIKEDLRPLVEKESRYDFLEKFLPLFAKGTLDLAPEGCSGTYFLSNPGDSPSFVIKPFDEYTYCLNNPRSYATPFRKIKHDIHEQNIPLYHTVEREAFCYELAHLIGIDSITPFTTFSILTHDAFHLLLEESSKEKLCSIQEYLQDTDCLGDLLQEFLTSGYQDEEICRSLDREDFENLSLFLWLTYDNDAHFYNFRAYPKTVDPNGGLVYGIQKIDNALTFPEENKGFTNHLLYLPQANFHLSSRTKLQIALLPLEEIEETLHRYSLSSCIPALNERVSLLKDLSEKDDITYYQVGMELKALEKRP